MATSFTSDIRLDGGDFHSTTATVEPLTDAGREFFARHFGSFAVSATLRKSEGLRFAAMAETEGLTVSG